MQIVIIINASSPILKDSRCFRKNLLSYRAQSIHDQFELFTDLFSLLLLIKPETWVAVV